VLRYLRDLGNTVIIVEHDEEAINAADHIVDIGPGAGTHGGDVIASGSLEDIINAPRSLTGQFLSGKERIEFAEPQKPGDEWIRVEGASGNNLKDVDVELPFAADKWQQTNCRTGEEY